MSGTHSHTAEAQADVARSDVQDRKPNTPPGHVEADRPAVRRIGNRQVGAVFAGAALLVIAAIAAAFLIA